VTFPIQTSTLTSAFGWNETAGRYINLSTGRFISPSEVRDALETVMDASAIRMNNITQQLVDGSVSMAEWQSTMMEQIKVAHTAAAASARGGWAQMSQSDWGAAGRMIRTQYEKLNGFAEQVASGKQKLNGQALMRADLYADAPRGTFEEMRRRYETMQNGAEEERRNLGEADHCDGCLDQAELGWQPVGTLDPIGGEECLTRCHCKFSYRKMGQDGEWIVSESDGK
jgi:hypothetical protein